MSPPQESRDAPIGLFRRLRKSDPDSTIGVIRRLLGENFKHYRLRYGLALILMGLIAASTAASAWIMKDVVNEIFVNRNAAMILPIAVAVLIIYVTKGFSTYGMSVILNRIGNNIVARNQKRLYDHYLTQGIDFFQRFPTAQLVTRMSHSASGARDVLNTLVMSLGRDLFSLIGLTAVMILQDPRMSLIALVVMPIAVSGIGKLIRKIRRIAEMELQSLAKIISATQETGLGIRVVKAFNLEGRMQRMAHEAIDSVEMRANKITGIQARTAPLMETLGGVAVALVIVYGGYRVIVENQDPGSFFAFLTAMLMAYEPARRVARLNVNLQTGIVGARMMYKMLDIPSSLVELPGAPTLEVSSGHIRLTDVTFGYKSAPVLRNVTLEAAPGRLTALVGPSGAGKTTVFALIERFCDPWQGTVSIDGQAVDGVSISSLRDNIALVTQETFLFDGTVKENIAMGRPNVGDEDIIAAAKGAHAHEFIEAMPMGYDTPVGEAGGQLSGGQRQRLAIARAMLRDAPILLLDEATSALDAESESKIQEALDRLMKGRTTIVIAHRLSTVRRADVIYVMNDGEVVEVGSHVALMEERGLYENLYSLQFSA